VDTGVTRGGGEFRHPVPRRRRSMAKLIHTMIRVLDLERSKRFYRDAFGLEEVHRLDFPSFALVYLRNAENDCEVELTLNKGRKEPYTHGDGYGHIAVCVGDAAAERERLAALGCTPGDVKEFKDDAGKLLARYFFVQDPDGYKIEVLERHGHYA
jgi:lactoylglutathione lyase